MMRVLVGVLACSRADGRQSWACKQVATQLANRSLVTAAFDVLATPDDCGESGFSSYDGVACFRNVPLGTAAGQCTTPITAGTIN